MTTDDDDTEVLTVAETMRLAVELIGDAGTDLNKVELTKAHELFCHMAANAALVMAWRNRLLSVEWSEELQDFTWHPYLPTRKERTTS